MSYKLYIYGSYRGTHKKNAFNLVKNELELGM